MTSVRKVLLLALAFPPQAVGSGTYAHRLALGLQGKGAEVLVLAPADPTGRDAEFDRAQPYATRRLQLSGPAPWRYWQARRALRRTLRDFAPDSLWTTNGMATRVAGSLLGRELAAVALVSCMRGSDIVGLSAASPGGQAQLRCYRRSRAIAAASAFLKEVAVAKGVEGERIFVNPSGFDFSQIEDYCFDAGRLARAFPALGGRPYILGVARLTQQKRVGLTVEAFARVAEHHPDLCYAIAGDGPEEEELRLQVEAAGLQGRVVLLGRVEPMSVDLFDLYGGARAFVMAGVGEGLPNVFIEASAFGLPCIGVRDGGTPEIVVDGDNGLLAGVDDAVSLASCIERLVRDEAVAVEMGRRAFALARERFSAASLAERSYEVLVRVTEENQGDG